MATVQFGESDNNLKVTHFAPMTHCAPGYPIKLVFLLKLCRCKIVDEICKLQIAKYVVAKFQQDTCRGSRS